MVTLTTSSRTSTNSTDDSPKAWADRAACLQTFNPLFFPEQGRQDQERIAKRICMGCVVVLDCLEYALETRQKYGVWGAKNPKERQRMIQSRLRERRFAKASTL